MSAGTDKLDAAMAKHSANKDACQAANFNKAKADSAFASSAQEVKDALDVVKAEADQFATDATTPGTIPFQA